MVSKLLSTKRAGRTASKGTHHATIAFTLLSRVGFTVLVVSGLAVGARGIGIRGVWALVVGTLLRKLLRGPLLFVATVRILVTSGDAVSG